jgi:hypothetical protein
MWDRYVVPLRAGGAQPRPTDQESVIAVARDLSKRQSDVVDQVFASLPSIDAFEASINAAIGEHKRAIDRKICDLEMLLKQVETIRQQATNILASLQDFPSFTEAFAQESSRAKFRRASATLQIKFRDYLAKWFDPAVLTKIISNPAAG